MIKYINIFKKNNKIKCVKSNSKETILICDRGRPGQIFYSSLFAYNINKNKRYNAFVLSDKNRSYFRIGLIDPLWLMPNSEKISFK